MDMKKISKVKYEKIILSVLSSSVAFSSCDQAPLDECHFSKENFSANTENGATLLPMHIYLGDDARQKIAFIESFVDNILSNEEEAIAFCNNRELILEKHHLNDISIDRNSPEIQLLFAITDKDILDAIKQNDVKLYMEVLRDKGLFQTDKFKTMTSVLSYNTSARVDSSVEFSPVAICALVVAIYVGLATVAETYVMVHTKFAMWGIAESAIEELYMQELVESDTIKLWQLKSSDNHLYDITDNLQNSIVEMCSDLSSMANLTEEEQKYIFEITKGTIRKQPE